MKILFINLPYYGHVVPTIGLVQELIKQDCTVTYLLPNEWEDKIKDSGSLFVGYQNHKQLSEQIKNAYTKAESIIADFDLIIYEQFFFLGKHLADKYNKPSVRIFSAPVTNRKLMDEYLSSKGPLSIFKNKLISKLFTKDIAKNIPLLTDNWLDEIIYNPPGLNLVYTLYDYQPYADEFDKDMYKFLGPSIYNRNEKTFIFQKTRPIIYISLGTVIKISKSFFQCCIDAFKDENVDVIISSGNFNINMFKDIPSNIHFYNFVPQTEVLKIADVFVTHGGMNSVSEALVSQTPMVLIPFHSDQPVNARCVEKLKVGRCLNYSTLNKSNLNETVLSVLNDNDIKMQMINVQQMIKDAPGNAGGARYIIEYFNNFTNKL